MPPKKKKTSQDATASNRIINKETGRTTIMSQIEQVIQEIEYLKLNLKIEKDYFLCLPCHKKEGDKRLKILKFNILIKHLKVKSIKVQQ